MLVSFKMLTGDGSPAVRSRLPWLSSKGLEHGTGQDDDDGRALGC
jgi:hypothetical protein